MYANVIHKKLHEAEWNGSETVWHDRSFVTETAHLKVPPGVHTWKNEKGEGRWVYKWGREGERIRTKTPPVHSCWLHGNGAVYNSQPDVHSPSNARSDWCKPKEATCVLPFHFTSGKRWFHSFFISLIPWTINDDISREYDLISCMVLVGWFGGRLNSPFLTYYTYIFFPPADLIDDRG